MIKNVITQSSKPVGLHLHPVIRLTPACEMNDSVNPQYYRGSPASIRGCSHHAPFHQSEVGSWSAPQLTCTYYHIICTQYPSSIAIHFWALFPDIKSSSMSRRSLPTRSERITSTSRAIKAQGGSHIVSGFVPFVTHGSTLGKLQMLATFTSSHSGKEWSEYG